VQSKAGTVEQYLAELPPERQPVMQALRDAVRCALPAGFAEAMNYGMIGYVVPHSLYAAGYHGDPKLPVPFINLASQKQHIAVYHMALQADAALLQWFTAEHAKASPKRLDIGKACIRYNKPDDVPVELIGQLAAKMTPRQWIELYEKAVKPAGR
jgi:hypothetical protein